MGSIFLQQKKKKKKARKKKEMDESRKRVINIKENIRVFMDGKNGRKRERESQKKNRRKRINNIYFRLFFKNNYF